MRALNLTDLTRRWRVWRELDHMRHTHGLATASAPAHERGDDAASTGLPEELIVPRPPRLD